MAITTTRLRKQAAQQRRMVTLYRSKGAARAAEDCERAVEKIEQQIADREAKKR